LNAYVVDNTSYYRYQHTLTAGSNSSGSTDVAYYVRGALQARVGTDLDIQGWSIDNGRYSGPAPFGRSALIEIVGVAGEQNNAIRSWTSDSTFDLCTSYPDSTVKLTPTGQAVETGVCRDTSPLGDGWGWNGAESCQIENNLTLSAGDTSNTGAVLIKTTAAGVNINGVLDPQEWSDATTNDVSSTPLSLPVAIAGIRIDRGVDQWKIMHDSSHLYLALTVPDNTPFKDSVSYRHDDSVEIFIDAGNQRGLRYDDDDAQFILRDSGEVSGIFNSDFQIIHSRRYLPASQQYVYEIQIRKLYFQLSGGAFGLNIQVNNDQNGGLQDAKWGWVGESGNNVQWFQPSSFGHACLDTGVLDAACTW